MLYWPLRQPLCEVMAHDFWGVPMASPRSHLSYRPLAILSFRVQHCLSGFAGFHFHAANVVLHSAATHQFLHVATLALPRPAAVLAALLFALHAVHVECVAEGEGRESRDRPCIPYTECTPMSMYPIYRVYIPCPCIPYTQTPSNRCVANTVGRAVLAALAALAATPDPRP